MDTTRLRNTLLTLTATASLAVAAAAPAAHAQAKDPGGTGASGHQGCTLLGGHGMSDGQINTYRYPGMRGSFTCTDGTVCETWTSTYGGHTTWGSDCWDAPAQNSRTPPHGGASGSQATAKAQAGTASR